MNNRKTKNMLVVSMVRKKNQRQIEREGEREREREVGGGEREEGNRKGEKRERVKSWSLFQYKWTKMNNNNNTFHCNVCMMQ